MPATPEIPGGEPQITERKEEFIIPETLQQSTGIQVVPKNFSDQVKDDHGQSLIQTPPTQIIEVTLPTDAKTLDDWSKGPVDSSRTWLGMFWRMIFQKALHFGWRIIRKEKVNAV